MSGYFLMMSRLPLCLLVCIIVASSALSSCSLVPPSFTQTPTQELPSITSSRTIPAITETATLTPSATITSSPTPEPSPTLTSIPWIYVFPVQPNKYVFYSEGTAAHGYPAIDIFAPHEWQYVAVTGGTVEFVSFEDLWDPTADDPNTRGGVAIAIIGDDGIRYYGSHLSRISADIKPGMRVEAGQVLGFIGESGNARGRGAHLHFGISRPTSPEDWKTRRGEINPFPYLNAWAAGLNVTPIYSTPTPKPAP